MQINPDIIDADAEKAQVAGGDIQCPHCKEYWFGSTDDNTYCLDCDPLRYGRYTKDLHEADEVKLANTRLKRKVSQLEAEIENLKTKLAPEIPLETELQIANLSVQSLSHENTQLQEKLETSQENYRRLEAYLHEKIDEIELLKKENARIESFIPVSSLHKARNMEVVRYWRRVDGEGWIIWGYYYQADEKRKELAIDSTSDAITIGDERWEFVIATPESRYDMEFLDVPF